MNRAILSLIAAIGLSGCGEVSYIVLEVNAELDVPNQVDNLVVTVLEPDSHDELFHIELDLTDQTFPIEIVFEPSEDTPSELEELVVGRLGTDAVARIRSIHEWKIGAINRAVLPSLEPIP